MAADGDAVPAGHPASRDAVKRHAYLAIVALTTPVLVALAVVDGIDRPYWGVAYPTFAAYNVVLGVAIFRDRLSFRAIEALLLAPVALFLLGALVAWRFGMPDVLDEPADLVLTLLWTGMTFPLCFLVLGTRRGLLAALAIYGTTQAVVLPAAATGSLPSSEDGSLPLLVSSIASFFAVLIALLWVLASRLEQLAAARARARMFEAQATTDPLTGLPNRRQLDEELTRRVALAQRNDHPLSIVWLDLDRFKVVNDRFGHEVGDDVLVEIGRRLRETVRAGDVIGRWGGEELLVVAPHTGHAAALALAERGRAHVGEWPFAGVGTVTASFGVATLGPDDDARSLLRRADLALYTAKRDGRDQVVGLTDLDSPYDASGSPDAPGPPDAPGAPGAPWASDSTEPRC